MDGKDDGDEVVAGGVERRSEMVRLGFMGLKSFLKRNDILGHGESLKETE